MLKSLGRSILWLFARPAPTSVALMVGPIADSAANDDQSQLQRAMRAASAAEAVGEEEAFRLHESGSPAIVATAIEIEDSLGVADRAASANDKADVVAVEASCDDDLTARDETLETVEQIEVFEPVACDEPVKFVDPAERLQPAEAGEFAELEEGLESVEPPTEMAAPENVDQELVHFESDNSAWAVDAIAADEAAMNGDETAESCEPARDLAATDVAEEVAVVELVPLVSAAEEGAEEPVETKPRKKRAPAMKKVVKAPRKAKTKADAADAVVESVPEDDVWVSDAVAWSLSGEWTDGAWSPPESADCPRRLEELREAAAEGRLTIWGRSSDAGTWQPIDASYWKSGTVETASLAQGRENVVAELKAAKAKGKARAAQKFSALKVSRAQVEELWRPDEMH